MKINKKKQKKTKLIIALSLIAVLICCAIGYLYMNNRPPTVEKKTDSVPVQNIDHKDPVIEQKPADQGAATTDPTPVTTSFAVAITSANVTDKMVQVRGAISNAISNDGICDLTFTKDQTTVSKSAKTYALPNSSTCQGFNIDRNELSAGSWQINLTVTINGEKATANSNITLE